MAIFPPDYKPLASPMDHKGVKTVVGVGMLTAAWSVFPGYPDAHTWRHPDDPPIEDFAPQILRDVPHAFGSTAANPVFGNINSTAQGVVGMTNAPRNATFRVASSGISASRVLFGKV